jgi:dihydroorotate dehydrogenase electron transfer subunit
MPYAHDASQWTSTIVENLQLAQDTYRVRIDCPELARRILPGQFVMLRISGCDDPLLGRPFALYDTIDGPDGVPTYVDIVYLVLGKMTTRLARMQPRERLDVWGPLGNGFEVPPTERLIMVAGGIGQTPFLALGKEHLGLRRYGSPPREVARVPQVTLCYGVRTAALLAGAEDFSAAGIDVRVASDDGSLGHHGYVTDLLRDALTKEGTANCQVVCCGPEPMMEAVAHICESYGVPCWVSLETPMACGIGICFSCVAKVKQPDGTWDYRRTCVEGPVFDASSIEW